MLAAQCHKPTMTGVTVEIPPIKMDDLPMGQASFRLTWPTALFLVQGFDHGSAPGRVKHPAENDKMVVFKMVSTSNFVA